MGFHFQVSYATGSSGSPDRTALLNWIAELPPGRRDTQCLIFRELIGMENESLLIDLIGESDPLVSSIASAAIWDFWHNEMGEDGRRELDRGIHFIEQNRLQDALEVFEFAVERYPGWAEAINKYATVLFLLGRAKESLRYCQNVVRMKPHHFGAWNGMVLCSIQLEDWESARYALQRYCEIQPHADDCAELGEMIQRGAA